MQIRPAALLRLDPLTLAPTAAPIRLSPERAAGLAADGGYVWTSEPDAGDVLRIDAATRLVSRVHVGGFPVGVTVAGGNVWFADRDGGKVGRLDPRTLRPVGKPLKVGGRPGWLASVGRSLFAADPARGTVASLIAQTAPSPTVKAPPCGGTRMLATSCAPARPVRTRVSVDDAKLLTHTEFPPATTTAADAPFAGGATRIG